uniref:Thioredoxin domain-containing protein 9-like n=1 Tax=Hirondellea gigas TaxID=1518452 RepID=A0A2P2HX91_9CRUS
MAGITEDMIGQQLAAASQIIETQVDAEIERLDNLDGDELENIRKERMAAMRKRALKKNEWIANGHGEYRELSEEKEFFECSKKSENMVCHFYREGFERCRVVDKHFSLLARKHIETKFCKINAEKAPFLTGRLNIHVLPTIVIVKEGKTKDFIVGFTDLGNRDDFNTEMLEWRIARSDVIEYSGDLLQPPTANKPKKTITMHDSRNKKTIRSGDDDSDDSDY